MVNFCAVCGCCTRTDIVREHLEDTLRICDVSAMGLVEHFNFFQCIFLQYLPTRFNRCLFSITFSFLFSNIVWFCYFLAKFY
jgi:hypothetical protein